MPNLSNDTLTLRAQIEQKRADLPPFIRVPTASLPWTVAGTTTVLVTIDETDGGRRSLKRWTDELWFIDLPRSLCKRAGRQIGDEVTLQITVAPATLPAELARLLSVDETARRTWHGLSRSQQRIIRESVAQAKRAETRERRARRHLCGSTG